MFFSKNETQYSLSNDQFFLISNRKKNLKFDFTSLHLFNDDLYTLLYKHCALL